MMKKCIGMSQYIKRRGIDTIDYIKSVAFAFAWPKVKILQHLLISHLDLYIGLYKFFVPHQRHVRTWLEELWFFFSIKEKSPSVKSDNSTYSILCLVDCSVYVQHMIPGSMCDSHAESSDRKSQFYNLSPFYLYCTTVHYITTVQ